MIYKKEKENFKDMNLLVISPHFLTFIKDQITCLAKQFNEIKVIVPLTHSAPMFLQRLSKQSRTHSRLIDSIDIPQNVKLWPLENMIMPLIGNLNQYFIFRSIDKLIQKENLEFDLIHAHFTWPAGYIGAKLKEKYGVPLVVTAHGYDIYDLPFRDSYWQNKIRNILDSADYIITVSNKNLDYVKKLKLKTRTKVIPNGFDEKLFHPKDKGECGRKLDLPSEKKIILTVGNLVEAKGQKYLIEAIKKLIEKRRDVLVVIIGSGILKQELENLIVDLNLEDYVRLLGGKPRNEIPFWINACDVFVLSSLNEGNPTVMFECIGCGKPFVGTKVGGIPEIISSKDYGLLCEAENSEQLVEKILISLDKKWNEKNILNHAKQFIWEKLAEEILHVYVQAEIEAKNRFFHEI